MAVGKVFDLLEALPRHQPLRKEPRSAHAAVIYDENNKPLAGAEDVGRHNALDKAVGKAFLNHTLGNARLLTLSSRISFELVQKSARAKIPIIAAVSRPTALAVELAEKLHMALVTYSPDPGLFVFTCRHRLSMK
jgi:FdhD protein